MVGKAVTTSPARPTEVCHPAIAAAVSDVTTPHFERPGAAPEERHVPSQSPRKRVNVTVTVLGLAGLFVKDGAPKPKKGLLKKFPSRGSSPGRPSKTKAEEGKDGDASTQAASTSRVSADKHPPAPTTVVASFSRVVVTREGKPRVVTTHVPSLPLPLPSVDNSSTGGSKTLTSPVRWPEQPQDASTAPNSNASEGKNLSSYQFQHTFRQEERNPGTHGPDSYDNEPSERYVPQPLDIQVAISRSGRLFKLGAARLLLSGEEDGERTITVPVANCNPAVPKSGSKLSKVAGREKMIPMMKLKGDTLKCGLHPNATLRVLVHVSEPLGETLKVGPNMTVTMISNSDRQRQQKKEEERRKQRESYQRQNALAGDMPSADGEKISWEYNPTMAAVVAKGPKEGHGEEVGGAEGPMVRVFSLEDGDERDDEEDAKAGDPSSCTSSAYMSAIGNDRRHQRYPTKGRSELTSAYSAATRTTATDMSTVISDLTDGRSWLSQTGIEVISPFGAPDVTALDAIHVPANSRLKLGEADGSTAVDTAADTLTTGASLFDEDDGEPETPAKFPQAGATKKGWRQRLTCSIIPMCGATGGNAGDHLSAVNEEGDVVVTSTRWGFIRGCDEMAMHQGYDAEDDGSSVDDDNSSNDESNLCK